MSRLLAIAAVCLGLGVAGCGGGDGERQAAGGGPSAEAAKGASTASPSSARKETADASSLTGETVAIGDSQYGTILTDGSGRTLYLFAKERSEQSRCYDACAQAWPPFLTEGEPKAGSAAREELLGISRRSDGETQVTYRGHPLYYYEGESQPGEVLCQGVEEFGGLWLVVGPDGSAIR